VFLYCRCQPPASTYLAGQVIIQQPLAAPSSPSGSHSLPLIYQAPSSAGHTYQYIDTRRLRRKQGRSQACCGGTHSSDEDTGAYMANTNELARPVQDQVSGAQGSCLCRKSGWTKQRCLHLTIDIPDHPIWLRLPVMVSSRLIWKGSPRRPPTNNHQGAIMGFRPRIDCRNMELKVK